MSSTSGTAFGLRATHKHTHTCQTHARAHAIRGQRRRSITLHVFYPVIGILHGDSVTRQGARHSNQIISTKKHLLPGGGGGPLIGGGGGIAA